MLKLVDSSSREGLVGAIQICATLMGLDAIEISRWPRVKKPPPFAMSLGHRQSVQNYSV